jgi:hypothetical protein
MNYIEREVERLRPDVAVIRAMPERQEVYLYTERFEPSVFPALPTHWDRFNVGRDVTQQADIL